MRDERVAATRSATFASAREGSAASVTSSASFACVANGNSALASVSDRTPSSVRTA